MGQQQQIDASRLNQVMAMELQPGGHDDLSDGMCVMEAVSYVAGEAWSDTPECACPVIGAFLRNWNDSLPDDDRNELLRDLIPQLVGTRSTPEIEQRRATMAADWLIRTHTPAWLRLAKLDAQADALANLPEITAFAQCPGLMPALEAVRRDSAAAWDAAWAAAGAAAGAATGDAAGAAAWAAAGAALADTKRELQQSAKALVIRMIEVQ